MRAFLFVGRTLWFEKLKENVLSHHFFLQNYPLSPGQTIATWQRNISRYCWEQHVACVWPPCCDMLRLVGCCWLKFDHFQTCANNTQHVATHRDTVAKRAQQCCVDMLRSFGRGCPRLSHLRAIRWLAAARPGASFGGKLKVAAIFQVRLKRFTDEGPLLLTYEFIFNSVLL